MVRVHHDAVLARRQPLEVFWRVPIDPVARQTEAGAGFTGYFADNDRMSPLRDVQGAMGHADPRSTRRYDRSRHNLDRQATWAVGSYLATNAGLGADRSMRRRTR